MNQPEVTNKIHSIEILMRQIDAYLSMIQKGEIEPKSGFSLISKCAKSIAAYCEGVFEGEVPA